MNILIFYNSQETQSIAAAAILQVRYKAETITLKDLYNKNEGAMTTAINTVTIATQDRVFDTCIETSTYSAAGHPSVDVNVALMTTKIKAGAIHPWHESICVGVATATKNPILLAWEEAYPTVAYPPIVKYMGGLAAFPTIKKTADSMNTTTLTDATEFGSTDLYAGQFCYIVSATVGAGQVVEILSNTTTALTFVSTLPLAATGTIVYGITPYKDDCLREEALTLAVKAKLWNISSNNTMAMWYRLLDLGSYDTSFNSITDGNLVGTYWDRELFDGLVEAGRAIYEYSVFPDYGPLDIKKLK
jgi:hypothetical protein